MTAYILRKTISLELSRRPGSTDYLWILSRTRVLPDDAKRELLAEAVRRGYDTGKLIWVKQE